MNEKPHSRPPVTRVVIRTRLESYGPVYDLYEVREGYVREERKVESGFRTIEEARRSAAGWRPEEEV